MAQELSVADREDDIFDSGFFTSSSTGASSSSSSLGHLWGAPPHSSSGVGGGGESSSGKDGDSDNADEEDNAPSHQQSKGNKKRSAEGSDWKASYVDKLSRKVRTGALTREDDEDRDGMRGSSQASSRSQQHKIKQLERSKYIYLTIY